MGSQIKVSLYHDLQTGSSMRRRTRNGNFKDETCKTLEFEIRTFRNKIKISDVRFVSLTSLICEKRQNIIYSPTNNIKFHL